jgi:hypothetical protein
MPTVAVVDGIKIQFYFNDHPPPHFHGLIAEHRVMIDIETLEVTRGRLPRTKQRRVLEWASSRRDDLLRVWFACQAGEVPEQIQ